MSTLNVNTLLNAAGDNVPDNFLPLVPNAWVYFDGTGAGLIIRSHNVTTITDTAVGNYTINFTNPMANIDYLQIATSSQGETSIIAAGRAMASCRVLTENSSGTNADAEDVNVIVFGGQS